MKVLVVGATGGSGRAAVEQLLASGHEVTAFSRSAAKLAARSKLLRTIDGDATNYEDVDRAVNGQDAVVVTLGISENPLRVRLRGSRGTPIDVRSRGTGHVITSMRERGVRRLVVQTSYGVGVTRHLRPLRIRLIFRLLLAPQIVDTERQDLAVRESGLDWVLAQPVNLTDEPSLGEPFASLDGTRRGLSVSRAEVGRFLARAVTARDLVGRTVTLSSGAAKAGNVGGSNPPAAERGHTTPAIG